MGSGCVPASPGLGTLRAFGDLSTKVEFCYFFFIIFILFFRGWGEDAFPHPAIAPGAARTGHPVPLSPLPAPQHLE